MSIQTAVIPQDWRDAIIAPLHKKGSKNKSENYRPVSLTSIISKLLESIVKDNLVKHLDKYALIRSSQHGFTSGKSCLSNLLDFFEEVTRNLDEGEAVDLVYLDFAKAFDIIIIIIIVLRLFFHTKARVRRYQLMLDLIVAPLVVALMKAECPSGSAVFCSLIQ